MRQTPWTSPHHEDEVVVELISREMSPVQAAWESCKPHAHSLPVPLQPLCVCCRCLANCLCKERLILLYSHLPCRLRHSSCKLLVCHQDELHTLNKGSDQYGRQVLRDSMEPFRPFPRDADGKATLTDAAGLETAVVVGYTHPHLSKERRDECVPQGLLHRR